MEREQYKTWVYEALVALGGWATIVDVIRQIWADNGDEIRLDGDSFYTWQYDLRWGATALRKLRVMVPHTVSPNLSMGSGTYLL